MAPQAKYTATEIERRWLVSPAAAGPLDGLPWRDIEDLYISGSRLRLRKTTTPDGNSIHKLGKKYGKTGPLSEPVTSLYLSEAEFALLAALPGSRVHKRRYALAGGSLDVYAARGAIAIFEMEFASEEAALRYQPPAFAGREVTGDTDYSGAALAGAAS